LAFPFPRPCGEEVTSRVMEKEKKAKKKKGFRKEEMVEKSRGVNYTFTQNRSQSKGFGGTFKR